MPYSTTSTTADSRSSPWFVTRKSNYLVRLFCAPWRTSYEPVYALLNASSRHERERLTLRWCETKLIELKFIGLTSALIASAWTSAFQWPLMQQAHPVAQGLWYSGLMFSLTSICIATQQSVLLVRLSSHSQKGAAKRLRRLLVRRRDLEEDDSGDGGGECKGDDENKDAWRRRRREGDRGQWRDIGRIGDGGRDSQERDSTRRRRRSGSTARHHEAQEPGIVDVEKGDVGSVPLTNIPPPPTSSSTSSSSPGQPHRPSLPSTSSLPPSYHHHHHPSPPPSCIPSSRQPSPQSAIPPSTPSLLIFTLPYTFLNLSILVFVSGLVILVLQWVAKILDGGLGDQTKAMEIILTFGVGFWISVLGYGVGAGWSLGRVLEE